MFKYHFNKETQILETAYPGKLTIEGIVNHYKKISLDKNLPNYLRVLIDCRDSKMSIEIKDIELTNEIVKKALKNHSYIKEAIIVDKPFETTIAMLFEQLNSDPNFYDFEIFCTENSARNWLLE